MKLNKHGNMHVHGIEMTHFRVMEFSGTIRNFYKRLPINVAYVTYSHMDRNIHKAYVTFYR